VAVVLLSVVVLVAGLVGVGTGTGEVRHGGIVTSYGVGAELARSDTHHICKDVKVCRSEVRVDAVNPPEPALATGPAEHPKDPSPAQVAAAVMAFALLAEPTRVRLLWALRNDGLDVTSLAAAAGCRPTVASQHLSKLRFAGLVEGVRDGRRVVYRLRGGHVRRLLDEALFHADHHVTGEPVHE
jgi:DNA-binding transcriptional ArsR family regulator